MARIMAIDYGKKRTGIAVTDTLQMIANSLETVKTADIWQFLKTYTTKEQVETIVVGFPKKMDGTDSESVEFVAPFIKKLKKVYPEIAVTCFDERFTSKIAFQSMIDGGVKKMARRDKAMVDKISANLILQDYLNFKKRGL